MAAAIKREKEAASPHSGSIAGRQPPRRGPGRPPADQADTAKRIIDAAERLFAGRGIEATSLREIAVAAGQRNTMAVQYHFGSKERLVQAVFASRVAAMEPRRLAMLDAATNAGRLKDARTLLEILHLPYLDLTDEDGNHVYAAFLADYVRRHRPRGLLHPVDLKALRTEALHRVLTLLGERLDYVPFLIAQSRLALVNGMFLTMLLRHDAERVSGTAGVPLADLIEDTLNIMTAAYCEAMPRTVSDWSGWRGAGRGHDDR